MSCPQQAITSESILFRIWERGPIQCLKSMYYIVQCGAAKYSAWFGSDFSQDMYVRLSGLDLFSRVQSFFVWFLQLTPPSCSIQPTSDISTGYGGFEKQSLRKTQRDFVSSTLIRESPFLNYGRNPEALVMGKKFKFFVS